MKVLMINGSRREKGCTYTALHLIEQVLNQEGIETEIRKDERGGWTGARVSCLLCVSDRRNCLIPRPLFLEWRSSSARQAGGSACVSQTRRNNRSSGSIKQVSHLHGNASDQFPLLEYGTRKHARRGYAGCGRRTDHGNLGQEYGLDFKVHRGRQAGRNYAASCD